MDISELNREIDAYLELKEAKSGALQGSVLGPSLYLIFTGDVWENEHQTIAIFADVTAIQAVGNVCTEVPRHLQLSMNTGHWTKKWKIISIETKWVHVNDIFKNSNTYQLELLI